MIDSAFSAVDFHCHLDLFPDHAAAVAEAEASSVYTLAVTTTPRAWPRNQELSASTRFVRAALGLHPQIVAKYAHELALWERYLPEARYIGEVGLDAGPGFYRSLPEQKRIFRAVLERCAEAGHKVLTVHCVRSATMVLDMIEQYLPRDRGSVVLHWFTGSNADVRRAAALGCYFSVNIEMMRSGRGLKVVGEIPMDRMLTETDGPFTRTNQRPSRPCDVGAVVETVAVARGVTQQVVADSVHANLKSLLASVSP